ncbi:MAG TPA: sigma-70 family RNA polymerase sigma factor [Candidatus Hydrogenedentes bacterium]|nr:sigma-70 family RNA polymerase sigma factor [Candidatus Hydrogenedentota bacterium]
MGGEGGSAAFRGAGLFTDRVNCVDAVQKTDEELMVILRKGDREALAQLVRRYQNDIFRFCLHYVRDYELARELAQETFVRVYVARQRFDETRKFRPWVLCIARNLSLNELKRKKSVHMESLEEYASTAREDDGALQRSSEDAPDRELMGQERREILAELLDTLDAESREIVILRFFERMPARDIAEVVGSTEGAIRTRLHRILKALRERSLKVRDFL